MEYDFEIIARKLGLRLVILFGSRITGRANDSSDYDVAYEASKTLLLAEMSELVVALAGKLLWGDEAGFLVFRVLAWRRYLDTAKLRKWREASLEKIYAE